MIKGDFTRVLKEKVKKVASRIERKRLKPHRRKKLPQFTTMNVIEGQANPNKKF